MGKKPVYNLIVEDRYGTITDEYTFEEGELIIGRSKQSDVILPSDNVSRKHARIFTAEGGCFVEDLSSSNGVFVNGKRIQERQELRDRFVVRIGDYHIHFNGGVPEKEEEQIYLRLVGLNLVAADEIFEIKSVASLLGRGKDCAVTIVDPSVSRVHAKITYLQGGVLKIEDNNSSNGTFLNAERIKSAILAEGDKLRLGNVEFLVEIPSAETAETEPGKLHGLLHRLASFVMERQVKILWGVTLFALALVVTLLVLYVPEFLGKRGAQAPEVKEARQVQEQAAEVKKIDIAGAMKEIEAFLKEKDLDRAVAALEKIKAEAPFDQAVRKMENRLIREREAFKRISEAFQKFSKNEDVGGAIRQLKGVEKESVYFGDAEMELNFIKDELTKKRKQICSSGTGKKCREVLQNLLILDPENKEIKKKLGIK
ncbi:MAG: FHA domain-containing protein [Deltaproteobacteria bacterium]|nr:FHA domain-containing protein [Deltaproteobacteria bacterium]